MFKTVFCDLDDTLIPNNYAYYLAALDAAKLIVIDLGIEAINPLEIIKMATKIQVEDTKELGYISEQCFPVSYMKTYIEICEKINKPVNSMMRDAIGVAAMNYILKEYKFYPGAEEALKSIQQRRILVTRGNTKVQGYKIQNLNLERYFDDIEIVKIKNKETFKNLLDKYQLNAKETIMIGDNIRNDIYPALMAGLHTIHVKHPHIDTDWEASLGDVMMDEELKSRNRTTNSFVEAVKLLGEVN